VTVKLIRDVEKKPKIAICTPIHDSSVRLAYLTSMVTLLSNVRETKDIDFMVVTGESVLSKARNTLARKFLESNATHLLFIDSDQGFLWSDIDRMIQLDKPIVIAPVQIKLPNQDAWNVRTLDDKYPNSKEPFRIHSGGTGFMLIQRQVFDKLKPTTPKYYDVDGGKKREVYGFFNTFISDGVFFGEDIAFCNSWRKIGGEIWCMPAVKTAHIGNYQIFDKPYPVGEK